MLTSGGSGMSAGDDSGATLTAYLKDDRSVRPMEVIKEWKPLLKPDRRRKHFHGHRVLVYDDLAAPAGIEYILQGT